MPLKVARDERARRPHLEAVVACVAQREVRKLRCDAAAAQRRRDERVVVVERLGVDRVVLEHGLIAANACDEALRGRLVMDVEWSGCRHGSPIAFGRVAGRGETVDEVGHDLLALAVAVLA